MASTETLYGRIDNAIYSKLAKIKLLACDVDGVFSDGRIYLGNDGEELKAFHTRDGYGIKALMNCGVDVAVITGRNSNIVTQRMQSLGVKHVIQGQVGKQQALAELASSLGIATEAIASIGDDMPDVGMFAVSNLGIAVNDAHPLVKQKADWITQNRGGFGAVREVCDVILQALGQLEMIHGASV